MANTPLSENALQQQLGHVIGIGIGANRIDDVQMQPPS
jgi:hypothetical protein